MSLEATKIKYQTEQYKFSMTEICKAYTDKLVALRNTGEEVRNFTFKAVMGIDFHNYIYDFECGEALNDEISDYQSDEPEAFSISQNLEENYSSENCYASK